MLNWIILQGRLTRDPELRATQSGTSVVTFTVAVDRDVGEKQADFFNVTAWRGTAEFVSKYFRKGSMIIVTGRLQTRKYEKDGAQRTAYEIVTDRVYFGDSKRQDNGPTAEDFMSDDDLPM